MSTARWRIRWAALVTVAITMLTVIASPPPPPASAEGEGNPDAPAAVRQLAVGSAHACALDLAGRVRCWGNNGNGRLGLGDTANRGDAAGEMGDSLPAVDLGTGRTASSISAGSTHTCALLDNASVKCWGANGNGRLGLGDTSTRGDAAGEMGDSLPAVSLGTGRTATAIAAAGSHTCALLDNAQIKCWGNNASGQLGLGDSNARGDAGGEMGNNLPAVDLGAGHTATAVTVGNGFSCALLANGKVKCWGNAASGQLGYGNTTQRGDGAGEMGNALPGVELGVGRTVVALSSGDAHTCALLDDRTLKCWGSGNSGRLGLGDTASRGDGAGEMGDTLAAVNLGAGRSATAVSAGEAHTCAVLDNGAVKCWGNNASGQLGQGNTTTRGDDAGEMGDALATTSVGTGRTVLALNAGGQSTCVRLDNARTKCWGENSSGQAGLGNVADRGDGAGEMGDNLPAVELGARRQVLALGAGASTCALFVGGFVKCWGSNGFGQLGLGDTQARGDGGGEMGDTLPYLALGSGERAVQIDSGTNHVCARLRRGQVKCWGSNTSGRLGLGDTQSRGDGPGEMGDALPAIDLGTGRTATAVSAGFDHTCALLDDATVKCWGNGATGQLGLGDTQTRGDGPGEMGDALPTIDLGTGRTATTVVAGGRRTCAILDNGPLKCWGESYNGQLGLGTNEARGDQPGEMGDALPAVDLGTGRTAVEVGLGLQHACALLDNGAVKCWGFNGNGELGLGDTQARGDGPGEMGNSLPALALGTGRTATALTLDQSSIHTCAVLDDGTLKCWGSNVAGKLGYGDVNGRGNVPGEMGDALPVVDLGPGRSSAGPSVGAEFTCSVLDDATVKCWGNNPLGQLGLGDTDARGDDPGEMGSALPRVETGSEAPVGISGTVTASGSGTPLAGALVAVLRTTDFAIAGGGATGRSGNYLAEVPPGSYFVYAIDGTGRHTAGFFGTPTLVTVGTSGLTDADPALARLRGTITGTITDAVSAAPLTNAWGLTLSAGGVPEIADPVSPSGVFSAPDLATGNHYVAYVDGSGDRATEFYLNSPSVPSAQTVPVTAGGSTTRSAGLAGQTTTGGGAALTGRVTSDGGAPIADALVIAMHAADFRLARIDATDANGQYALDLTAGSYKLVFLDAAGRHGMEWFNNQPYFGIGAAINTSAPGTVDAALTPATGTVTGVLTDAISGASLAGAWAVAIAPNGGLTSVVTAGNGSYEISGLAPGSYRLTFVDPVGGRAQEYFDNSPDYDGGSNVNVIAGSTTSGINAGLS